MNKEKDKYLMLVRMCEFENLMFMWISDPNGWKLTYYYKPKTKETNVCVINKENKIGGMPDDLTGGLAFTIDKKASNNIPWNSLQPFELIDAKDRIK